MLHKKKNIYIYISSALINSDVTYNILLCNRSISDQANKAGLCFYTIVNGL
uniref:Uncharacterized protein n=1 Tax=Glossina morsitans morsitans TaxID=37546 RepID=A0A1B0G1F6_GLOMM